MFKCQKCQIEDPNIQEHRLRKYCPKCSLESKLARRAARKARKVKVVESAQLDVSQEVSQEVPQQEPVITQEQS